MAEEVYRVHDAEGMHAEDPLCAVELWVDASDQAVAVERRQDASMPFNTWW